MARGDAAASSSAAGPGTFEIYLAWSDQTLQVGVDATALSALITAGIPVEPGCMTGICGMCATAYVEGDPVHRDSCLTPKDREKYFCPCVTRAKTRIVLAL